MMPLDSVAPLETILSEARLRVMLAEAAQAARVYASAAKQSVLALVSVSGRIDKVRFEAEQHATHGLAWITTYAEALAQTAAWVDGLARESRLHEVERQLAVVLSGEYLAQLGVGVPMTQLEVIRPADMGLNDEARTLLSNPAVAALIQAGTSQDLRGQLAIHVGNSVGRASVEDTGLDETHAMIRDQFRRFADEKVVPFAHEWHLKDELIPLEIFHQLAELGVFGLTIPEQFGGAGLGKIAMCVVSEELSRGYIGVGSLGTRTEIAAELILHGGTPAQKEHWLPKLASAEILPTAVFTEPNTGSDLGSLRTKATKNGDTYTITGNKTWITHGARADMMTLLARTDGNTTDFRGLSMFLAEKPRGMDPNPFPAQGMSGGEIEVLGYRGMKEFEIAFDGFTVPAANLLGGVEGLGFKQLMATFESARIQTAARAVGVAQCAFELGLRYALDRVQFGKPIFAFPRVANKLVMMAAEIMAARQLTYFSANEKDGGRRCDLEAGMAKLLGARVAWAAADNALQIHGGNGFALEYPISRVLCDARILNIFEGAGEIQAQVIARRLLEG
jgi:(2S)-methylsuccinyl-CoA dehydrogenase